MQQTFTQKSIGSGTHIFILLFFLFIGLIISGFISVIIMSISGQTDINLVSLNVLKVLQTVQEVFMFLLPALLLVIFFEKKPVKYLTLDSKLLPLDMLLIVGLTLSIQPCINWLGHLNSAITFPESLAGIEASLKQTEDSLSKLTDHFLSDLSPWGFASSIIVVALVAAVCEEFFFRGVLQQLFIRLSKNIHLGIWITAIIFSAIHLQFYGFIPRVILGALLGYTFVWTKSIWAAILMHFLNNALAVVFHYLYAGTPTYRQIETFGTDDTFVYTLAGTGITAVLIYFLYKTQREKAKTEESITS